MRRLLKTYKSLLSILFMILSLVSCKFTFPDEIVSEYDTNPFLEVYDISLERTVGTTKISHDAVQEIDTSTIGNKLRFVAITDVHLRRDLRDSDVTYFHDHFYSYLNSNKPPFLLCLGDLTDDGHYDDSVKDFVNESVDRTENNWFVYCIGNHERRAFDEAKWNLENAEEGSGSSGWDLMNFSGTMGCYAYGDLLSIYKLDTSMRIIGRQQFQWLEEALKQDKAKYRIIIGHDNITSGGVLDQSLFLFGFADIQERNKLYKLMDKYNIGVVLVGHHHKGNIEYKMSDNMGEINLAAYHRKETNLNLESEGYFYEAIIDTANNKLTVNGYLAEKTIDTSREPDKTFVFNLPVNN